MTDLSLLQKSDTFDNLPTEADIPDIPDTESFSNIRNDDFLDAIFFRLPDRANVIITSFEGDPQPPKGKVNWSYTTRDKAKTLATANNYFCVSSSYPDAAGVVKRTKACFAALHCIVLDDVGQKVVIDRVTLDPSWAIETSQNNWQYGYILEEPIKTAAEADRLMNAVIDAGLCDKGASGATARNMRLPVAINGKAKYFDTENNPWQCRLTIWRPELHYSVDDLVNHLKLDLANNERPTQGKKLKYASLAAAIDANDGTDVYVPRPSENPVIAELKNRGFYKQPRGDGRHDVTCPWLAEHTDQNDQGSVYFEPSDTYPHGGFKCQHSHGDKYRLGALLEFLRVSMSAARMKPTIRVTAGELNRIVDRAERELLTNGRHYQRGGIIVTIVTDPATNESAIQFVSASALTRALSSVSLWERFDGRSEEWVRCDPPARHVTVLFDGQRYDHLLPLAGLARQPYLRANGQLVKRAGYDHDSTLFGIFNERDFLIPDNPTREDALAGLLSLSGVLSEFAFADEHDRAAALSCLLTAAIRPTLSHAPMFHVKAAVQGSGKSFLCKIATAIATPAPASPVSFPESDEECGKLLLSLFLKSPAVIEFDDLNGDIQPYSKLKTAITEESVSGRILGSTKEITVGTRTLILSSGNNVTPVRDMSRRVLTINLDPRCEIPAERIFKHPDLLEDVKAKRGRLVSDCLAIVLAWIVAGRPKTELPTIASFNQWSDLCRHSLVWLGLPDPAAKIFEQMKDDPDAEFLARFLNAWELHFGTAAAMVRDLTSIKECPKNGNELIQLVREIAEERDGTINSARLGRWIKRHEGRFIGSIRLIREKNGRNANAWRLSGMSGLSGYSNQSPKVENSYAELKDAEMIF